MLTRVEGLTKNTAHGYSNPMLFKLLLVLFDDKESKESFLKNNKDSINL